MTLLKIAQMGEPVLRETARPLTREELRGPEIQKLIDDMIETMEDAHGAGIAAPQVFRNVRLCVLGVRPSPRYPELPELPVTVLANPVITPLTQETFSMYEGCLSVTGLRGRVSRPRRVALQALDRRGEPIEATLEGVLATVVQHEADHLDGVLFVDRAEPRTLTFLREYERYVLPRPDTIDVD